MTDYTTLSDEQLQIAWRQAQGWRVRSGNIYPYFGWMIFPPNRDWPDDQDEQFRTETEALSKLPPVTDTEWLAEYDTKVTYGERRNICKTMSRLANPDTAQFKRLVLIASLTLTQQEKE